MKENLKPCVYKLSKGEVKYLRYGAEVKARANNPKVRSRRPETG